jgi:hypothetical protein
MNRLSKIAMFLVLGLALVMSPHAVHAYYPPTATANKFTTTVNAEKKSYGAGEPIVLSGTASPYEEGRKLSVIVRDAASNIIVLKTVPTNPDGTYSYTILDTAGWKKGAYNVAAQYGTSDVNIGTTAFSFDPTMKTKQVLSPVPVPEKSEKPKETEVKKKKTKKIKSNY